MGRRKKRQFPGSPQRRRGLPGRTQNCRKFHAQRRHPALLFCGFARMRRCMGRGLRGYWVFPAMKYTGFSARSRRVLRPYQVKAFPLRRKQQPAAVAVRPLRRGNNNNNANKQATALQAEHVHAATHAGQNGRQPPDERESTPGRCRSACVRPCPAMRQATPAPPSPPGPRTQSARLPDGETRSPGWPSSPILTYPHLTLPHSQSPALSAFMARPAWRDSPPRNLQTRDSGYRAILQNAVVNAATGWPFSASALPLSVGTAPCASFFLLYGVAIIPLPISAFTLSPNTKNLRRKRTWAQNQCKMPGASKRRAWAQRLFPDWVACAISARVSWS